MLGFRGGAQQTVCDRCYRPKRSGEDGWERVEAKRRYRTSDEVVRGELGARFVRVVEDRCPWCIARDGAA